MSKLQIGDRVEVTQCSGIDSGRRGTIVSRSEVQTNGRGIPLITGHYRPMGSDQHAVRDDAGRLFTMFKNRLIRR